MNTLPAIKLPDTLPEIISQSIASDLNKRATVLQAAAEAALQLEDSIMTKSILEALNTQAKFWLEVVDRRRRQYADPLYRNWRAVNKYFAPYREIGENIRSLTGKRIGDYEREQRRLEAEKQKQIEQRQETAVYAREIEIGESDMAPVYDRLRDGPYDERQEAAVEGLTFTPVTAEQAALICEQGGQFQEKSSSYEHKCGKVRDVYKLACWLIGVEPSPSGNARFDVMFKDIFPKFSQSGIDTWVRKGAPFPSDAVEVLEKTRYVNNNREV